MKDKKKIMIAILCTLVAIMAVGYALLAQQLNVNGRSSIDSTWKVEITNITEKDVVGDASSKVAPSYTALTANFSVGLIQPGDSITYDIEISNLGTLKAKLDSINVVIDENDAITYTTSGVKQGDKLGVGEKVTLTVKVEYNSNVTSQPTNTGKDLTVTINCVQDLGNDVVTYNAYSIGDKISFAGSNWYVIKNSTSEEDYVTLMKEKVLTSKELGEYASNYKTICTASDVFYGSYGCTIEGKAVIEIRDTIQYYWSDVCHSKGFYGYTEHNYAVCEGHNDYEGSKVREFLEDTYINTLGSENLKEVDGYKIRLITRTEIHEDLGWTALDKYATVSDNSNVPIWVYRDYGERNNEVYGYWTMTSYTDTSTVWIIDQAGHWSSDSVTGDKRAIRPVINLLKSSI